MSNLGLSVDVAAPAGAVAVFCGVVRTVRAASVASGRVLSRAAAESNSSKSKLSIVCGFSSSVTMKSSRARLTDDGARLVADDDVHQHELGGGAKNWLRLTRRRLCARRRRAEREGKDNG
jgi:hypothetical protein